ncbi:hypothetical protein AA313_de0200693 [Arthrobotrys entomopaga]|nr:hypothetical protein AA313_de0200693 [Arthrobotrys entomopaga]
MNDSIVKAWIKHQENVGSLVSVNDSGDFSQVSAVAGLTVFIAADYLSIMKAASLDLSYLATFYGEFDLAVSRFYAALLPPDEQKFKQHWIDLCSSLKVFKEKWGFMQDRQDSDLKDNSCLPAVDTGRYSMVERDRWFNTHSVHNSPDKVAKRVIQFQRREYDQVLFGLDFLYFPRADCSFYVGVKGRGNIESGILTLSMEKYPDAGWTKNELSYLPLYSSPTKISNFFSTNMEITNIMDLRAADYENQRIKTVTWTLPSPIDRDNSEAVAWLTAIKVHTANVIRIKTWAYIRSATEVELNTMTWFESQTYSVSIGACVMPKRSPDRKMRSGKIYLNAANIVCARSWFIQFDPPFQGGHAGEIKVMAAYGDVQVGYENYDGHPSDAFVRLCTTGISDTGFYLHFNKKFKTILHQIAVTWVAALQ